MVSRKVVLTIVLTVVVLSGAIPLTGLSHPAYASAPASAPGEDPVSVYFNETGWPGSWSLNVSSMTMGSSGAVINGMRTYEVSTPDLILHLNHGDLYGYTAYIGLPERLVTISNLFTVTNSTMGIALNFAEYSTGYRVFLNVTGLPQRASWSPFITTVSGMYLSVIKGPESPFLSNNSYEIFFSNGTYLYAASAYGGAFHNQTWIIVHGKPVNAILQLQQTANPIEFQAAGLPSNDSWQFDFTNVHFTISNSTVFPFTLKGNESGIFLRGQGFTNFTVTPPPGYQIEFVNATILYPLTGKILNETLLHGNSTEYNGTIVFVNASQLKQNYTRYLFYNIAPSDSIVSITVFFAPITHPTSQSFPWWTVFLIVVIAVILVLIPAIVYAGRRRHRGKQTQPLQEPDDISKGSGK